MNLNEARIAGLSEPPTYYGLPAIKRSPWDWKVAAYLFVSALAGGAQVIAGAARAVGGRRMAHAVRNARYIGLAGAGTATALVVRDLKTPQRFYNMLRIFRRTSAMSMGTYILCSFSFFSLIAAWREWRDGPGAASVAQLPAALSGVGECTYTAPMLAATSTPLWSAESELLAARYGVSAIGLAASTLAMLEHLGGRESPARTLDALALVANAANALITRTAEQRLRASGADAVLREPKQETRYLTAMALSIFIPVGLGAIALLTRSRTLSIATSVSLIAGTALSRASDMYAGNRSADRPDVYLHLTRGDDR